MARTDDDLHPDEANPAPRPMAKWRRIALTALALVFVTSIGARALVSSDEPAPSPSGSAVPPELARGLVDGPTQAGTTTPPPAAEPDALEAMLPFLTESSFFALIGFALGYTTRKFVKIALIFLAIFFFGLQLLSYSDIAQVDWGRMISALNDLIFNLKENRTFTEILSDRVPTVGALLTGYVLGFRRG